MTPNCKRIVLLLTTNVGEKSSQNQEKRNLKACTLFAICISVTTLHSRCYNYNLELLALQLCTPGVTSLHSSCRNFALVLHKNALVFSRSEARNFFMNIIIIDISHSSSILSPNLTCSFAEKFKAHLLLKPQCLNNVQFPFVFQTTVNGTSRQGSTARVVAPEKAFVLLTQP